jgi:toxin YoeB
MYKIEFAPEAQKELLQLQKSEPIAIKKLTKLLEEMQEHPKTGTGQVELMKHCRVETWSRRITAKHRLVYRIYEDVVEILVLSVWGHYDDK